MSLKQPSLLQFFRPQQSNVQENAKPANGPNKRTSTAAHPPQTKRRRLSGRLVLTSDDEEESKPPTQSQPDATKSESSQQPSAQSEPPVGQCDSESSGDGKLKKQGRRVVKRGATKTQSDNATPGDGCPRFLDDVSIPSMSAVTADDDASDPGEVEDLIAKLDQADEGPSWFAEATQKMDAWLPPDWQPELPSNSNSVLRSLTLDEEAETDARVNLYLNQVPVAKGPHGRFWKAFVEAYYEGIRTYKFPRWIDPHFMKDHNGLPPTHPEFDCQRIRVNLDPKGSADKMHFTPAMIQYWEVKKDHFNKMIFFKLGKFYEIFYTDACILQPICDLKWMGSDEKAHVGFPEVSLQHYARKVIDAGFAVTVVEQMETPGEMQERSKAAKAVHREVCEIYTRGTVAHEKMIGPEPVYLLTIVFEEQVRPPAPGAGPAAETKFAFLLTDVATSNIRFGVATDRVPGRHEFRTLLAHSAPQEVLMAKADLPAEVLTILQTLTHAPKLTYSSTGLKEVGLQDRVRALLTKYYTPGDVTNPHTDNAGYSNSQMDDVNSQMSDGNSQGIGNSQRMSNSQTDGCSMTACPPSQSSLTSGTQSLMDLAETDLLMGLATAMMGGYLKELLMEERVMRFAQIAPWAADHSEQRLVLDAAAMNALEVLSSRSGRSLFDVLNRCSSAFGVRLLRRWLTSPLTDPAAINERLDAVEWLLNNPSDASDLREYLRTLPDLERLTARTCAQALQGARGAVFFNNTADKKIEQFLTLLDHFRRLQETVERWATSPDRCEEPPARLRHCLTPIRAGGFFPDLAPIIDALTAQVEQSGGGYVPKPGVFAPFDNASAAVEEKKAELQDFLDHTLFQEVIGLELTAAERQNVAYRDTKFRYEVEVPESLWAKIEHRKKKCGLDVAVTSQKKDWKRFHVNEIKQLVAELEALETKRSNELYPFMQTLFAAFNDHAQAFCAATGLMAEIDVLTSFAFVAELWQTSCRPTFSDQPSRLAVKRGYHPVLVSSMPNFVPNDIELNSNTLILTGPNMGGKSTLARQVALQVLMAQTGCFVPAQSFELSPVDRIFARVGAHDAILEGKSTFYVELEETLDILQRATSKSLCVIDEFGRGTSIEEGAALAQATVRYITDKIGATCLFSTHFQEQLYAALHCNPRIGFWHMAAVVDEDEKQIVFLYKLKEGLCPDSHGLKVARIAGVPESVLRRAEETRARIAAQQ